MGKAHPEAQTAPEAHTPLHSWLCTHMDTQIIDLRKSYSGYIIPANLSFLFEIIQFEDPGVSQVPAEELYPEEQSTSNFFKVPHLSPLSPPAADPGR